MHEFSFLLYFLKYFIGQSGRSYNFSLHEPNAFSGLGFYSQSLMPDYLREKMISHHYNNAIIFIPSIF